MQCKDKDVISGRQKQKDYKCDIENKKRKTASGRCSAKIKMS
jgi:hypothetical protein